MISGTSSSPCAAGQVNWIVGPCASAVNERGASRGDPERNRVWPGFGQTFGQDSLENTVGDLYWGIDWHGIFTPKVSLLELVVRGTIMYFVLFGLLRAVRKRQTGGIGTTDVLVIVLLAEVAGNGFAAEYKSVVEGAVLVGTILFWSYAIEWAAHRFPAFERLLRAPTLLLIENGKMLRKNMRAELVTTEELMAQLREKGIGDIAQVKQACMEADGMISVVKMRA